ncbi:MAG: haloacid dehalogenase-like hydrolase [Syntrophaceae bacterium]|nr:haloacid dehalogenase-like hydrolase [Syntrophaceae bacterium]
MSKPKKPKMAICYDFDGTLSKKNMQEYDFIPQLKMANKTFWNSVKKRSIEQKSDEILTYMLMMLEKANQARIQIKREAFVNYGKNIDFFFGVKEWFKRMNDFAMKRGIKLQHFIISSGIGEMIEGTSIHKEFKKIYASTYMYEQNGVAHWPASALNYTTKTQFLFRINKGILDVWDNTKINKFIPKPDRPIPFTRMIYIGDGSTDVPCMKLVKEQGGHSVAVYQPGSAKKKHAAYNLLAEDRVNFVTPADYRVKKKLDQQVKAIITKISADYLVDRLEKECKQKSKKSK